MARRRRRATPKSDGFRPVWQSHKQVEAHGPPDFFVGALVTTRAGRRELTVRRHPHSNECTYVEAYCRVTFKRMNKPGWMLLGMLNECRRPTGASGMVVQLSGSREGLRSAP